MDGRPSPHTKESEFLLIQMFVRTQLSRRERFLLSKAVTAVAHPSEWLPLHTIEENADIESHHDCGKKEKRKKEIIGTTFHSFGVISTLTINKYCG